MDIKKTKQQKPQALWQTSFFKIGAWNKCSLTAPYLREQMWNQETILSDWKVINSLDIYIMWEMIIKETHKLSRVSEALTSNKSPATLILSEGTRKQVPTYNLTCFSKLHESVKISNNDESRKEEAIFLCLVKGWVVSACAEKQTNTSFRINCKEKIFQVDFKWSGRIFQ